MDPLACYTTLLDSIEHGDRECAIEHADALVNWLRRGGFLPQGVSLSECKQAVAKAYEMPDETVSYTVICGNIGTVYAGDDMAEAERVYGIYCKQSDSGRGRAGGESVCLMHDDDIVRDHFGTNSDE